jgi:hypothetical protein
MFLGSREWPTREAENLTTIYEPAVYVVWDPQHLTTLQACTVCYDDSSIFAKRKGKDY